MGALIKAVFRSRALMLGLLLAALGFSYALATGGAVSSRQVIGASSVGTDNGTLHFNNIFLEDPAAGVPPNHTAAPTHIDAVNFPAGGDLAVDPDGFDLGDAVYGSNLRRYLTAAGGVRPYTFGGTITFPPGDTSTLKLDRSGCLMGSVSAVNPAPFIFTGSVTDGMGAIRTGSFYLFMLAPGAAGALGGGSTPGFDLADNVLADGDVGLSYIGKIETLNGEETFTGNPFLTAAQKPNGGKVTVLLNDGTHPLSGSTGFVATATPVHVTPSGGGGPFNFATLEAVGLSMTYDGVIHGVPLFSGVYNIDILAFDGRILDGSPLPPPIPQVTERTVAINVAANNKHNALATDPVNNGQVASDIVIKRCVIRTRNGTPPGADTFSLVASVNPNIAAGDTVGIPRGRLFKHQVFVRFGNFEYAARLDRVGSGVKVFSDGTRMRVNYNTLTGALHVSVTRGTFRWPGGPLAEDVPGTNSKRLAVGVGIEDVTQTAECLQMFIRFINGRTILSYRYGNPGGTPPVAFNRTLGGIFYVTVARGMDARDVGNFRGDRWGANVKIAPRLNIDDPSLAPFANVTLPDGTAATPGLNNLSAAQVRIGTWFESWSASDIFFRKIVRGPRTIFVSRGVNTGVRLLKIDDRRYVGRVLTFPIAGATGFPRTGIPDAPFVGGSASTPIPTDQMPLGIDLFRTNLLGPFDFDFHGEAHRSIFSRSGTRWQDFPDR